jgi:nitrogen fixation/metabolism regulation signal transduction histidine kinase
MKPKIHARRQYLVDKKLQLSYSWLLIVLVGMVFLIFGLSLVYINKVHLDAFQQVVGEEILPKSYIDSMQKQLLIATPVAAILISCLLLLMGIQTSHRIAGPLHRLIQNLKSVAAENQFDAIQLRKKDQLKEVADAFNQMVHSLKDRTYQDMRLINQVRTKIFQLQNSLKGETLDLRKLTNQVREIDRLTDELKGRKET